MENEGINTGAELCIAPGGVSVQPQLVSAATWDARCETDIQNLTDGEHHVLLRSSIVDDEGIVFGAAQTEADIAGGESIRLVQSVLCYGVRSGDEEQYTMITELCERGSIIAEKRTGFGFQDTDRKG